MTASEDGHHDRLQAARGLASVLKDQRTLDQFERTQKLTPLATEMLYGSCRFYTSLSAILTPMLQRPLRRKDQDVWALLIVGAYQLLQMRIPDHAAINATVAAAKRLKKPWASGLVNAILRRLQGQPEAAATTAALPAALTRRLTEQYGDQAPPLIAALGQRAPMALRVNTTQTPAAAYGKKLTAAGIGYRRGHAPETLILDQAQPAESLPDYGSGAVAIQDAGAQLAQLALTQLARAQPKRLLDACAAPGGKLFHWLEQHPGTVTTAVEQRPGRLNHLQTEAQRLGHTQPALRLLLGDATARDWWDGTPFDLILLDAPCSGSGTIRRHPDIALLRDFDDLAADLVLQDALLANLVGLLAPGGHLLYATCSVLAEENDDRIAALLAGPAAEKVTSVKLKLPCGKATRFGWQLLPTDPETDGFYYAGLKNLE